MKRWNTLLELFYELNSVCEYAVLRNYERYIFDETITEHDDVDIICDDAIKFIDYIGASRVCECDNVHVYINVADKIIRMDIRSVGDGYYDEKWEKDMLKNRILYKGAFYVLADIDYYYSIIYHEIFHKSEWRSDYEELLKQIASNSGKKFEIGNARKELESFMHRNKYVETGYRCIR